MTVKTDELQFENTLRVNVDPEVYSAMADNGTRFHRLQYEFDAACDDLRRNFRVWCKEQGLI